MIGLVGIRSGGGQRDLARRVLAHFSRKVVEAEKPALEIAHAAVEMVRALSQWAEPTAFCSAGTVPLDYNISEQEMKRLVLSRKNSLSIGSARGGRTAAILASLTITCRRLDVDPQLYLTQLLVNLSSLRINDLAEWLPDKWKRCQAALVCGPAEVKSVGSQDLGFT